jgi:hypothetical protein
MTAPLLPAAEIRRLLSLIVASSRHDRNRGKSLGMSTIAKRADLSRAFLYRIAAGDRPMGPESQAKLSRALADVTLLQVD